MDHMHNGPRENYTLSGFSENLFDDEGVVIYEYNSDTQVKLLLISGGFPLSFLDCLGSTQAKETSRPRSKD